MSNQQDETADAALVYISGRMTGTEDHGVAQFTEARDALRARGYAVFCPSEASIVHRGYTREQHLRRDISMVLLADEVCVLPGWEASKGAAIEVCLAVAIGLPVWEYDTGEHIAHQVLESMDPRRFIVPVDFMDWYEPPEDDPDGPEVEEESDEEARARLTGWCTETHIPFKGASVSHCNLPEGHRGSHRDGGGRTW